MEKMDRHKQIKVDYYDDFHCIADQCNLTCCQEWKIAVDDKTQQAWKRLEPPLALMQEQGERLVIHDKLSQYTTVKDDTRVIQLDTDKKCPFLSKKKLCNLVTAYGDQILSETCAIFPRQVNTFVERDVKEYSLVACCPAVIDLLKEKDRFLVRDDSTDRELKGVAYENTLLNIRNQMIQLVQNRDASLSEAMMMGFFILLSLMETEEKAAEYTVSTQVLGEKLQRDLNRNTRPGEAAKILDTIRHMTFSSLDTFDERNELFLDLAENYRKQDIYTAWLKPIAELAEQLSEEYDGETMEKDLIAYDKIFLPYEQLMRNYVASEYFANLYLPEYDLENIVIAFQWITMEYVTMKQAVFLQWLLDGRKELSYEKVRDMIVIVARMLGYDEPDIREYMESSFEELIWEWGYLALLCGR